MLNHLHGTSQKTPATGSMQGWARDYDRLTSAMLGGREKERRLREETIRLAQVQPGSRVLEAGCGTGSLTIAAARAAGPGAEVWGIDLASDMLARARQKSEKAGLPIHFQNGSITSLPFDDGRFDIALCSFMIYHIPDEASRRKGLEEIRRVLRPGGTLLIADYQPPEKGLFRFLAQSILGSGMLGTNFPRLAQLLEETGYRVERLPSRSSFVAYLRGTTPSIQPQPEANPDTLL